MDAVTETTLSIDTIMARRFELVEEMGRIAARHKAELAPASEELKLCELFIKDEMNKSGMQSCKTAAGMAYFTTKTSCSVKDFDAVLDLVKRENLWNLLTKAVSKEAVKEYIESAGQPPAGVEFSQYKDLSWKSS